MTGVRWCVHLKVANTDSCRLAYERTTKEKFICVGADDSSRIAHTSTLIQRSEFESDFATTHLSFKLLNR